MYPYVSYVTRMLPVCYPYVLVWCFSHDRLYNPPEVSIPYGRSVTFDRCLMVYLISLGQKFYILADDEKFYNQGVL